MNLKTSGLKDPLTAHGGCPVLVGSKWITNKWVMTDDADKDDRVDKDDDDNEDAPCQKLITYKWVHCWMMELKTVMITQTVHHLDHQDVILIFLT